MKRSITPIFDVQHSCFCPRCKRNVPGTIILPCNRHHVMVCGMCEKEIIGLRFEEKCPACSSYGPHRKKGDISKDEPLPRLCPHCQ